MKTSKKVKKLWRRWASWKMSLKDFARLTTDNYQDHVSIKNWHEREQVAKWLANKGLTNV